MPYRWQQQMGVLNMQNGPTQPFYNVMVNDGSNRYAAQGIEIVHFMVFALFVPLLYRINSSTT